MWPQQAHGGRREPRAPKPAAGETSAGTPGQLRERRNRRRTSWAWPRGGERQASTSPPSHHHHHHHHCLLALLLCPLLPPPPPLPPTSIFSLPLAFPTTTSSCLRRLAYLYHHTHIDSKGNGRPREPKPKSTIMNGSSAAQDRHHIHHSHYRSSLPLLCSQSSLTSTTTTRPWTRADWPASEAHAKAQKSLRKAQKHSVASLPHMELVQRLLAYTTATTTCSLAPKACRSQYLTTTHLALSCLLLAHIPPLPPALLNLLSPPIPTTSYQPARLKRTGQPPEPEPKSRSQRHQKALCSHQA